MSSVHLLLVFFPSLICVTTLTIYDFPLFPQPQSRSTTALYDPIFAHQKHFLLNYRWYIEPLAFCTSLDLDPPTEKITWI